MMKKIILLTTTFLFVIYLGGVAQTRTPKANARQISQNARIAQGKASGELTQKEARMLKMEQRHINRTKRRAKADGKVTAAERAKINRKQNRADRHIRRQKHDGQSQGGS